MRSFSLRITLLSNFVPFAFGIGTAQIINRCRFPVYITSVQVDSSPVYALEPGDRYSEEYEFMSAPNAATGYNATVGVSMKVTRDSRVGQNSEGQIQVFDSAALTQFEYTYDPTLQPGPDLYYDISAINDATPWQFCQWGMILYTDDLACPTISCPSDCLEPCSAVYNVWNENSATHGCYSYVDLTLELCNGVSV